jgi:hypothetical protein
MARIPIKVGDLRPFSTHYFMTFPDGRYRECLHCGTVFDMPSAADERCRKREDWIKLDGDPFRDIGTH